MDGRETAKAIFSDTIRKDIDQVRNIRLRFLDQREYNLPIPQWLDDDCRKLHSLDPETRIDGVDLLAKQPGQTFCVANRLRCADPDRLPCVVDKMEQEIEPAR
ncbi:hypothetical protein CEV33_4670, partial [Brucella grignonensis]